MEKKNIIIIGVIVVILAVVAFVFAGGISNKEVKTSFDTEFMSGAFVGNVEKIDTKESFLASYKDNEHNITYNLTTMDDSKSLMEIYEVQGVKGPDHRSYNGNDWDIYFGEAMPVVNNTTQKNSNQSMGIIICQSQKESQGYVIYSIFDLSKVNFTLNTFGDAYIKYIEPLLKSIDLKKSNNVPAVHEQFGMSKDDFNKQMDLIHQVKAGNYSAVQQQGK